MSEFLKIEWEQKFEQARNEVEHYKRIAEQTGNLFLRETEALSKLILWRKQAEEELRESKELLRATIESTADGILVVNEKGQVVCTNKRFVQLWRIPEELIKERKDNKLLDFVLDQLKEPEAFLSKVQALYKTSDEDFDVLEFKDGRVFERFSSPLIRDGQIAGRVWSFRDITERKIAEEEKTKLQFQLQQVQKMESIGTLAGGIAHEFNNILGIIVGNAELAMDDIPEWNPARQNLEEICTASLRARDVIKQILTFSRQTPQEIKPVRIIPIIKESLKFLRSSIPTTIEIHQNISSESGIVRANPTQINQVLINLCTNAIHAMREKGGVLEVNLENIVLDAASASHYHNLSPGKYFKLTVNDTGHGIEPKNLKRIFDPYFTTKRVGEGSGMGLSVVHGIVKSHGGAISINSEPGKGTIFDVLLPCIEDGPEPEVEIAVEISGGSERMLFVDDEKAMVDAIRPMIERLGYKVTARTSSIEGLEAFRENPDRFDLVITDFTMPDMTGMELAKALLKIRSDIPIILCTGYSEHINEDKAKANGVRAFLMKPVVLSEIANTIRKVLDDK